MLSTNLKIIQSLLNKLIYLLLLCNVFIIKELSHFAIIELRSSDLINAIIAAVIVITIFLADGLSLDTNNCLINMFVPKESHFDYFDC